LIELIARNAREDRKLTASRLRFPNRNRNRVRSLLRMLALRMQVPLRSWQQVSTCRSRRRDIIRITQLGAMPPHLRHADAKVEHEPAAGTSGGARARPQQNGVRGVRVGADLLACQRRYVSGNVDRTDRSRTGGRSGSLRLLARQMERARQALQRSAAAIAILAVSATRALANVTGPSSGALTSNYRSDITDNICGSA
jgi:hypothetical protein